MKKSLFLTALIVLVVISTADFAMSCSSFAVYADKPYYAMNFDYEIFPMKFTIVNMDGLKSFHLSFKRPVGNNEAIWVETAGMNSMGVFAATQEERPYQVDPPQPGVNDMYMHQLYGGMYTAKSTRSIRDTCSAKKLVQLGFVSVHTLFADIHGDAFIAEAGQDANSLTSIDRRFIIMTNFPNRSMKNKSYTEAKGKGDKRYIAGYNFRNISKNMW